MTTSPSVLAEIAVALIQPNPYQPRRSFDEQELNDLAASIREDGVLQNLVVRRGPTRFDGKETYFLIAGERRWRASQIAGLETVPCRVLDVSELKAGLLALVENVQRVDIGPLDQAKFIQTLIVAAEERGQRLSIADMAREMGKSAGWVQKRLDLQRCREDVQRMVEAHPETMSHGLVIDKVGDERFRQELIEETVAGATVIQIQARIRAGREMAHWKRNSLRAPDRTTQNAQSEHETGGEIVSQVEDALKLAERALMEAHSAWHTPSMRRFKVEQEARLARLRAILDALEIDPSK